MRGRLAWTIVGLAAVAMGGCKSKQPKQEVTELPPPAAVEPVPVEPYVPVATDAGGVSSGPFGGAPTLGFGGGGGEYIVQRGDTLWSISQAQYGTGQRWRDIVNANPGLVPERMAVGQKLRIP